MSYVVLARKWRPQRFEDLVGQDHVGRTLGNAIESGRVAHAFLFTGVRGVGKTTSARILAKALNCMRKPGTVEPGVDPGPTVTPCLECPACIEITQGSDMDVREIDGASHNGVEEVRKLQDSLPYRPSRDRYKIVIVDEVHMLSNAAWNAFLKTLEEPPDHVKFIFATTEVHKVPITILSRVQRFDFKMIPARAIAGRLRYVLDEEKLVADDTAVALLARQAAGSMRDAMSLLDQVIAFSGGRLVGSDVAQVLGVAGRQALHDIARALLEGDAETCLRQVGDLADQGFDVTHLARDLLSLLRDLVVGKVTKKPEELLDLSDEERHEVLALAQASQESDLLRLHQAFSRAYDEVARSSDPRAGLEMLLVRLCFRPPLLPVDELLHRLAHLEKRLSDGGARAPQRPQDARSARPAEAPRAGQRPPEAAQGDARGRSPRPHSPRPEGDASADDEGHGDFGAPRDGFDAAHGAFDEAAPLATPPLGTQPAAAPPASALPASAPPASARPAAAQPAAAQPASARPPSAPPASAPSSTRPTQSSAPASAPSSVPEPSAEATARFDRLFALAERLRAESIELAAIFEQTVPLDTDEPHLQLALEKGFLFEKQLTDRASVAVMENVLRAEWGEQATLRLVLNSAEATPNRTLSAERGRRKRARHEAAIDEVKRNPRVQEAVRILGADIKTVRVPEV